MLGDDLIRYFDVKSIKSTAIRGIVRNDGPYDSVFWLPEIPMTRHNTTNKAVYGITTSRTLLPVDAINAIVSTSA